MLRPKLFLAVVAIAAAGTASAFPIGPQFPPTSQVHEYFNAVTGHFFYTLDPAEVAAVDSGAAGPGWSRTGLSFFAYASIEQSGNSNFPTCDKSSTPCVAVSRFIGTPGLGPNSHFLTGNPVEVEILNRPGSGWTFETIAFAVPVPDPATGRCATGTRVYRAYNNRAMYNDSNHRYTASDAARARMSAEGWIDEGVAFCAYGDGHAAAVLHSVAVGDKLGIQGSAACDAETLVPQSCIAVAGLPVPTVEYSASIDRNDAFNLRTGVYYSGNPNVNANIALADFSRTEAANASFVQLTDWRNFFGIHLAAQPGTGNGFSSITPLVRLPAIAPPAGRADGRLFPFRVQSRTEYELRLDFSSAVYRISADPGSDAYGVAVVEFTDSRSGGRFRSHILAFGTPPEGEFAGRDATDGVTFVATSFRPQSPFGRNASGLTMHFPAQFQPESPHRSSFIWYVNRTEFQAMVDSARGVDPTLSSNPEDYLVRSFGIRNQIYGSGELGGYLYNASVSLMPR